MYTFEQVFNDHHQMSPAALISNKGVGSPGLMFGGGSTLSQSGILPCGLSHDAFHVTYAPVDRMTDRHN